MKPALAASIPLCAAVLLTAACQRDQRADHEETVEVVPPGPGVAASAIAVDIQPASGSGVHGKAVLTPQKDGVRVVADFKGAQPGSHGLHFHEKGDCSDPKAASAGEHFGATGKKHGLPGEPEHHLGDLGNVIIAADGTGHIDIVVPGATLEPGAPTSLVHRALILHARTDQGMRVQPSGDSGDRIGCGVVERGAT